jgi:hypothetical protein
MAMEIDSRNNAAAVAETLSGNYWTLNIQRNEADQREAGTKVTLLYALSLRFSIKRQ